MGEPAAGGRRRSRVSLRRNESLQTVHHADEPQSELPHHSPRLNLALEPFITRNSYLAPGPSPNDQNRSVSPRPRDEPNFHRSRDGYFDAPRTSATSFAGSQVRDSRSVRPGRADTSAIYSPSIYNDDREGLHRRSTMRSRQSRSIMRDRSIGADDRTHFTTLAGPEQTIQLAQAYENYVSPGYTDLNPAYEQPASAKPVWSLAKPLPRVLRSGMIPSRDEIFESRQNAELPVENSQKLGLDVNPIDLEEGRVRFHANPLVLAAQLRDSRTQREHNYINNLVAAEQEATLEHKTSRASIVTHATNPSRRARASTGVSLHDRPMSQIEGDIADEHLHDPELDAIPEALTPPELEIPHRGLEEHMATIPESRVPSRVPSKEDTHSLSTLAPEEDDDDEWPNLDSFKTVEQPMVFDEIHNNHTGWSVVRTQYREFLAEFLAVFMQLTMGFCVDIAHTVMKSSNPNYTAWGWGFATMVGIYVSGGISGAHLNPAITFMLWFFRGFPKRKIPEYWLAQLLGAFAAAFTAYGLYRASINNYLVTNNYSAQAQTDIANGFVTSQRFDYIDPATAFFNEFVGTAMLAATVLALGDDQNAPPGAGMNSLIIGFVISLEIFAFSYQSGAALNPTRDLGPRLALLSLGYGKQLFTNPYWFYGPWVGTFAGAFVGACMYDIAIFTGGESPINYPWSRTKRSFRKTQAKWRRRVTRGEKGELEHSHWGQH